MLYALETVIGAEFKRWLSICPHVQLEFTNFNSIKGELPDLGLVSRPSDMCSPSEITPFNLYIITGSHHGAYEELQWIRDLEAWIRRADDLKVPLLGICFGHQVIATALGGKVTVNPKGFEIGAISFALNEAGQQVFNGKTALHLYYTHGDAVVHVPASMENLGGNDTTECQAMRKGNHIVTIQGHPEFSHATLANILRKDLVEGFVTENAYQVAFRSLDDPLDADFVACASLQYLGVHPSLGQ
jgi:GMP synthase-like glutamine amidotransferase